jgi:hypothetical protein
MLGLIDKLLRIRKRLFLTVPHSYPIWHSRYGEETHLATRLLCDRNAKIHTVKFNISYWREAADKFSTGKYALIICYKGDDALNKLFYPLKHANCLHIQVGRFPYEDKEHILIEGRKIPVEMFACNEGYSVKDFLEWRQYVGSRDFCIVHFTEFRY